MPEQTTIKHVSNVQKSLFIIIAVLDLYTILINEQVFLEINFRMSWMSKSAVIPVHYLLATLVTLSLRGKKCPSIEAFK